MTQPISCQGKLPEQRGWPINQSQVKKKGPPNALPEQSMGGPREREEQVETLLYPKTKSPPSALPEQSMGGLDNKSRENKSEEHRLNLSGS